MKKKKKDTTGPSDANKGIIIIYDIFGYFPQTLQGADILGTSDDAQKYRVFIPDWFGGKPFPIEKFPPDTPEKQKDLGDFFAAYSPPSIAAKIPAYLDAVSAKYPGIKTWALLGVSSFRDARGFKYIYICIYRKKKLSLPTFHKTALLGRKGRLIGDLGSGEPLRCRRARPPGDGGPVGRRQDQGADVPAGV